MSFHRQGDRCATSWWGLQVCLVRLFSGIADLQPPLILGEGFFIREPSRGVVSHADLLHFQHPPIPSEMWLIEESASWVSPSLVFFLLFSCSPFGQLSSATFPIRIGRRNG